MSEQLDPYERVSMDEAKSIVESAIGGRIRALLPDRIHEALEPERPLQWHPFPDWELHEDPAMLERTGFSEACKAERVLVVSDACFRHPRGAIVLPGAELESLAHEHVSRFRDTMFGGDLIMVDLEGGTLWLFHHEGYYARTAKP